MRFNDESVHSDRLFHLALYPSKKTQHRIAVHRIQNKIKLFSNPILKQPNHQE